MDPLQPSTSEADTADRRSFLRKAAASAPLFVIGSTAFGLPTLMGTGIAAAQSGSTVGTARSGAAEGGGTTTTAAPFTTLPLADLALTRFLESLERAGTVACSTAVDSRAFDASANEVLRLIGRHHTEQAHLLQAVVDADPGGATQFEKVPAQPNAVLLEEISTLISAAAELPDPAERGPAILEIIYDLENSMVATCLFALGIIDTQAVAATVSGILPVHSQEAVVLGQMLDLPASDDLPSFERDADAFPAETYAIA